MGWLRGCRESVCVCVKEMGRGAEGTVVDCSFRSAGEGGGTITM